MPDLKPVPILPAVDLERERYILGRDALEKAAALELVRNTFFNFAVARASQEDRWRTNDKLYHGFVSKRYWKGTQVERSSIPVMISYDQVESAYPILTEALFDYYPAFFDVSALGDTHPSEADKIKDAIADFLDTPYDVTGLTALPHLSKAVRQAEIYGDGFIELSWDAEANRFIVEFVDIRDIYLDPQAGSAIIDKSSAVIKRELIPAKELIKLRGVAGVSIPTDDQLNYLAQRKFHETSDLLRDEQGALRKDFSANAFHTFTPDPASRKVEVLMYWTKERLIWVLGREWVAINKPNDLGFIPFCKAPFTEVVGQVYSMGLPDVLEGDQKYAQGIRNARLDNLALNIEPPRATSHANANLNPSKRAWQPGLVEGISNKDEIIVHKVENVTQHAFQEEQLIHQGAANRTGVNQLAQSGLPTPSNANRSATGVSQQQSAVSRRLRTAVKNVEDYMIVPMLYKIARMIQRFAPDQLELPSGGSIDKALFKQPMKFKMSAASRMIVRDRLAMFLGPISQLLFNEAVLKQANQQGKTLDLSEWERFMQDATATSKTYKFFREMSEEEIARANQPAPEELLRAQVAQQSNETRKQMGQIKAETDMRKAQLAAETENNAVSEKSAAEIIKALATLIQGLKDGNNAGSKGANSKSKSAPRTSRAA